MKNYSGKGQAFVRRMYLPRSLGLALGFFSIATSLAPLYPSKWLWALLVFNGFFWPHAAYHLARYSAQPFQAERRNLMYDSITGGFWAGTIGLNPLPSIVMLAMMAMNNIASGGQSLFWRGCLAQLFGCVIGLLVFSPTLVTVTSPLQLYATLPLLVVYPLAVGLVCYALALKLSEHKQVLEKLSCTDSLTGLLNHGAWKDLLQIEFDRCQTDARSTTLALIDIDHFKMINDTYGHLVGDDVLKRLGNELMKTLRNTDHAGRYGGDEFCVILPDTSIKQATEILERLRLSVSAYHDVLVPSLSISLSIGVAAFKPHTTDSRMWLNDADKALYAAKSTGRNKIDYSPIERVGSA